MICLAPKDREELQEMLEFAVRLKEPVSIRYPKDTAYSLGNREPIRMGKFQLLEKGRDICLIALGSMVRTARDVLSLLSKAGIQATLVNARFIKPLDETLLKELALQHEVILTLEEGSLTSGFGTAVLEFYAEENLLDKVRLIRAGFPCEFIPAAKREDLFKMYGLDTKSLFERLKKIIGKPACRQAGKFSKNDP